jgi:hypothetical protein
MKLETHLEDCHVHLAKALWQRASVGRSFMPCKEQDYLKLLARRRALDSGIQDGSALD